MEGQFSQAILNTDTGGKTFTVERENQIFWTVMDFVSGRVVLESPFGLSTDTQLASIERVGNRVVVIQRWRNGGWIRVRIFQSDGTLVSVMDIPGQYVSSTTDGQSLKALVFKDGDRIYQDLIDVGSGTRLSGVTGYPQNPITGEHKHVQYDAVNGGHRFVEVVYDRAVDETVIRLLDGQGRLVATQVLPGRYRHHRAVDGKKIFIQLRPGMTDAVVIDLETGDQLRVRSFPGSFRRIAVEAGGTATLTNTDGASVSFPLGR